MTSVTSGATFPPEGEVLLDTVCVYQPLLTGRKAIEVAGDATALKVGEWEIRRRTNGQLLVERSREQ